jgi:hypothetical protein
MRFFVRKRTQFIKKRFLFTVGSVCRVKQMFRWWRRGWNGGVEVDETTVKRLLCCGFRRTGKAMGQVFQCWWGIRREINVLFSHFRISTVLRFISSYNYYIKTYREPVNSNVHSHVCYLRKVPKLNMDLEQQDEKKSEQNSGYPIKAERQYLLGYNALWSSENQQEFRSNI